MENDTFVWRFTAFDQKEAVAKLYELLEDALINEKSIAVDELFSTLPIKSPQQADAMGNLLEFGVV